MRFLNVVGLLGVSCLAAEPGEAARAKASQRLKAVAELVRAAPAQTTESACALPKGTTGALEVFEVELETVSPERASDWRAACPDRFAAAWAPGPWLSLAYPGFRLPADAKSQPPRWLLVTRNTCNPAATRVVFDVFLVELATPKLVCGFRFDFTDTSGFRTTEMEVAEPAHRSFKATVAQRFGLQPERPPSE